MMGQLFNEDKELAEVIHQELLRQQSTLNLIASENYASRAVLEAASSLLTNKYSEGYIGHRYYSGNTLVDVVEGIAIERVKRLFNAEAANVQPHSGSQANMAAYFALLKLGDKIMGMNLEHGGHLTHGASINFSGKWYNIVSYGVEKETGKIDMSHVREIALREKPKLIVAGATAYPRELDFKAFSEIAKEVGAYLMVDMAHIAGLVAGHVHQSPVPYADIITSTTHKTLRGPRGAFILSSKAHAVLIDKAVFPGLQGGPLDHIIAAKAVAFREAMQPEFVAYAKQIVVNAKALAETLKERGLKLVSGGTDNHLMLIDITERGMSGGEAETILENSGITVNRNKIPFDPRPARDPSGIRLGTPALTTRGMKEPEMRAIGNTIADILILNYSESIIERAKKTVGKLCNDYPLYPHMEYH